MPRENKNTDFTDRFGVQVRIAREELGITQDELATRLDLSPNFISRVERGDISISLAKLELFCKVLKKNADFFFPDTQKYAPNITIADLHELENNLEKTNEAMAQIRQRIAKYNK